MPQEHGTTSPSDAGPSAIAIAPLGSAAAIIGWSEQAGQQARRGFRLLVDGQPVPPPATHCSYAHAGEQRHLLAVPARASRLAQAHLQVVALDGATVGHADRSGLQAPRPVELDPLALVPELEPRDSIRVVRFLLEVAPSLFRLGRDDAFVGFAHALVEVLAATPDPVAARCCAGPLAFFEAAAHRGIGDRLSAVLVARGGVSRVMTAPAVLPHPQPQRGLARIAVALERAQLAPESRLVLLGEGGIACRRLPATEPPLSAFERAGRDGGMDAALRNYIVDALAAIDDTAISSTALIRELRAATSGLRLTAAAGAIGGGVDLVLPSSAGTLVVGWLNDPHHVAEALTVHRRERATHLPLARIVRFRHAVADREQPGAASGFMLVAPNGGETALHASIQLHVRLGSGEMIALGDGPTPIERADALSRALDAVAALPSAARARIVDLPAVLHAVARERASAATSETIDIGRRSPGARVTILVPATGGLELIRCRFAALALEAAADAEIVHVLDDPRRVDQVAATLRTTAQIYGHGTRLAVATQPGGIDAAMNAAAAGGEAALLVLLGARAMPATPGWLGALRQELDAHPRAGLIAMRRIGSDRALLDLGFDRETNDDGRTLFIPRLSGFPAAHRAGRDSGPASACARGAWILRRSLFELVGGFGTDLLGELGTDLDFSCRVRAAGFELRQLATLDVLEAEDAPTSTRDSLALDIDQRTLLERWPFRPVSAPVAPPVAIPVEPTVETAVETIHVPDATPADQTPAASGGEESRKSTGAKRRARKSRRAA